MTAARKLKAPEESREARIARRDAAFDAILSKYGRIDPELVLDEAKDEASPLHSFFEWNDGTAATHYRIGQAYSLIASTRYVEYLRDSEAAPTVLHGEKVRKLIPAFKTGGFKMRREVLAEEDDRALWVDRKLSMLESWCREVSDVQELTPLRSGIQTLLSGFRGAK